MKLACFYAALKYWINRFNVYILRSEFRNFRLISVMSYLSSSIVNPTLARSLFVSVKTGLIFSGVLDLDVTVTLFQHYFTDM